MRAALANRGGALRSGEFGFQNSAPRFYLHKKDKRQLDFVTE